MLGKIIADKYFCGLDIGSRKIKAGIIHVKDNSSFEFMGGYENSTSGFTDGAVSNLSEFSESIHNTINELIQKTGIRLKEVNVGVGSHLIDCRSINTVIPLLDRGSKVITSNDIKRVNNQIRLLGTNMEEEVLHDLPQSYQVDDVNVVANPLGLYGRKLGVQSQIIVADANRLRNIAKGVYEAGFHLSNMYFSDLVASDVMLVEDDKKDGCVVVDLGAKETTMLIFKDGLLKSFIKVSIAGDDLTKRIANDLNLSFDLAEEIKKSYGSAFVNAQHREEEILVNKDGKYLPIKRGLIQDALEPEIDRLIEEIKDAVKNSGYGEQMNRGMIVFGGGCLLPGLIERIGQKTNLAVKMGKINVLSQRNLSNAPVFAPVVGLAYNGMQSTFRYNLSSGRVNFAQSWMNRIRDLYQEYF